MVPLEPPRPRLVVEHPGNDHVKPGEIKVTIEMPSLLEVAGVARVLVGTPGSSETPLEAGLRLLRARVVEVTGFRSKDGPVEFASHREEILARLFDSDLETLSADGEAEQFALTITRALMDRKAFGDPWSRSKARKKAKGEPGGKS